MQEALVVGQQVLVIFVYVGLGYFCTRRGIISRQAGRSFSNLTLTLVTPSVIINAYIRQPFQRDRLMGLGLAFFLAVVFHVLAILVSGKFIRPREDVNYRIERMAAIYSNCGFMGIPLIRAVAGDVGEFYSVAYLSIFNLLVWSNGVATLLPSKKIEWKRMVLNPGCIAFLLGLILYFTQLRLPVIFTDAVAGMSSLNTPLSMITTGIFLADINIRATLRQGRLYYVSALRLLVLPFMMVFLVKIFGVGHWMEDASIVVMASMLACACPTATTATLFPARFQLDSEYGAKLMGLSTLFSVITLPLISFITAYWVL